MPTISPLKTPKVCPICEQNFDPSPTPGFLPASQMEQIEMQAAWEKVRVHMEKVHPDYVKWEKAGFRRIVVLSVSAIIIAISFLTFLGARGALNGQWWTPAYLLLAVLAGVLPLLLRERSGMMRFREKWMTTHGDRVNEEQPPADENA